MSLFSRLLGKGDQARKPRVRICVECGMPIAEHKDWCPIRIGLAEMERKAAEQASESP